MTCGDQVELAETPDLHGAYPPPSTEQVGALERGGRTRSVEADEVLFRAGDVELALDEDGFVRTGADAVQGAGRAEGRGTPPYVLETSRRGDFAADDVRSGSIKRGRVRGG